MVRFAPTSLTVAKTLIQVKAGAAALDILLARVYQQTKTSASELLQLSQNHWSGAFTAGTVTSFTPLKYNFNDPAALAVGGTTATGTNASAEPSGGTRDELDDDEWNILNGKWEDLPIPEGRIRIQQGDLYTLKLETAPAAAMTIGAIVRVMELR